MIIGIFLLTSLSSQSFSIEDKSKVKLCGNGAKIEPWWTNTSQCNSDSWKIVNEPTVCSVYGVSRQNCSLLYGLYDMGKANELFVNISTETRKINSTDNLIRRTFLLFAFYRNSKNQDEVFTKDIGILPNSISDTLPNDFFETSDLISFSRNQNYSHVRLGLQESLYCGTVKSISLFYYNCPTNTMALVDFNEEAAPNKSRSPKVLTGRCTKNAIQISSSLNMSCYFNGKFEVSGSCTCKAGFTKIGNECKG